jgi:hypothetical protein
MFQGELEIQPERLPEIAEGSGRGVPGPDTSMYACERRADAFCRGAGAAEQQHSEGPKHIHGPRLGYKTNSTSRSKPSRNGSVSNSESVG